MGGSKEFNQGRGPRKNDCQHWNPKSFVTPGSSILCTPQILNTAQGTLFLTASSEKPALTSSSGYAGAVALTTPAILTRFSGPRELGPSDLFPHLWDLAQCLAQSSCSVNVQELNRMIILTKPSWMFHQHWKFKVHSQTLQPPWFCLYTCSGKEYSTSEQPISLLSSF